MKTRHIITAAAVAASIVMLSSFTTARGQLQAPQDTVAADDDSLVSVIAWFSERDTLTYRIYEGKWTVKGNDTVQTVSLYTDVMLTVTDSTKKGYEMEYRFLGFGADTAADSWMQTLSENTIPLLNEYVTRTPIRFSTDQLGSIKKYHNLKQVKKQARELISNFITGSALADSLSSVGLDGNAIAKAIDADLLVAGYIEELEMLFEFHGCQYNETESTTHTDASDTEYESDSYVCTSLDRETYDYEIIVEIHNYIPKEDVRSLVGSLADTFFIPEDDPDGLKDSIDSEIERQINEDAVVKLYSYQKYFWDGWPQEVIRQTVTTIGDNSKLEQKYIIWSNRSTGN